MIPHRCEFSLAHYREMLSRLREQHALKSLETYLICNHNDRAYVVMRHDVDVSFSEIEPIYAIELELGIRSTYFLRVRARGYAVEGASVRDWLRRAVDQGFEIGLQEEITHLHSDQSTMIRELRADRRRLEEATGQTVAGVATHMPKRSKAPLTSRIVEASGFRYEAGASAFNPPGTAFLSDANGVWKNSCPLDILHSPHLYLLTHPVWWVTPVEERAAVLKYIREGK